VKSTRELPTDRYSSGSHHVKYSGNGLLIPGPKEDGRLAFLRVPPAASQKPVEDWSIPLLPDWILYHVAYLPENLIAVAEGEEKYVVGVPLFVRRLDD